MKRQVNSRMCFVCGLENPIGLRFLFEEDEERVWHVAGQGYVLGRADG